MPNTELSKQLTVCIFTKQTRRKYQKSYNFAYGKIKKFNFT